MPGDSQLFFSGLAGGNVAVGPQGSRVWVGTVFALVQNLSLCAVEKMHKTLFGGGPVRVKMVRRYSVGRPISRL